MTSSTVSAAPGVLAEAEALGLGLPALLAEAARLAATVLPGEHGRRRAGLGDEFWQYRAAVAGDAAHLMDWRRSARSDAVFVREREWQAAQSVSFWLDDGHAMAFHGAPDRPSKAQRAQVLALALTKLLVRGGEKVALLGSGPARGGPKRAQDLAEEWLTARAGGPERGAPPLGHLNRHGRAVLFSDFLAPVEGVDRLLMEASAQGVRGVLCQILDPDEEGFPYDGRVVFRSMTGEVAHETREAGDLRGRYLTRLAERRALLAQKAEAAGWLYLRHHTGAPAATALLALYRALEGER